jgi:lysosomal Pro-X carboxypeptidase
MLSAWFRMKYPWHTDGSLAASAPVLQFEGTGVSQWIFNEIITNDFADAGTGCADNIREAFNIINQYGETSSGLAQISEIFKICQPLENQNDLANFINWVESALDYLAMTDYPYPSNFLEPLPGWPINVFCDKMDAAYSGDDGLLTNFAEAIAVYYNWTGQAGKCNNLNSTATPALGTISWDYQGK